MRARLPLKIVGVVITLLVAGAGGVAIFLSTRNDALAAYNAAPACASLDEAETGKDCRITETATVRLVAWDNVASETDIYFAFPGPYIPPSPARLPSGAVVTRTLAIDDQVPVEVWGYRVTKIADMTTADNPANDPRPANLRITGVLMVVLGCAAALALMLLRRLSTSSSSLAPIAMGDVLWR